MTIKYQYACARILAWAILMFWGTGGAQADQLTLVNRLALPGTQTSIVKYGSRLYLAAGSAGVHIVDVSKPTSPTLLGTLETSGTARGIAIANTTLYVADGDHGLVIATVADPAHPVVLGTLDTPGEAQAVAVNNSTVYVADGLHGLQIIDAGNPAGPVRLGAYDPAAYDLAAPQAGEHEATDVIAYKNYAILGERGWLRVLDVSKPADPALYGELNISAARLAIYDNLVYATGSGSNPPVSGVDLSNPAFPRAYPINLASPGASCTAAALIGPFLYLGQQDGGIEILDQNPRYRASRGRGGVGGPALGLALAGDLVYVANGSGGLAIMNHVLGPFLRFVNPGDGRNMEFGKPYSVRWIWESFDSSLTLSLWRGTQEKIKIPNIPATQGNGFNLTLPTTCTTAGAHTMTLVTDDRSTSATSDSFIVYTGPDTTPPQVTIDANPMPGLGTQYSQFLVRGSALDVQSGLALVEARLNGGAWLTVNRNQNSWNYIFSLNSGTSLIEARARDFAGNYSALASRVVTRTDVDGVAPQVQIVQPADRALLTSSSFVLVSGTAGDAGTPASGVWQVFARLNGGAWQSLSGTALWSGWLNLAPGENTIEVYCRDRQGNVSSIHSIHVISAPTEIVPPVVTITAPEQNQTTRMTTVNVTGTARSSTVGVDSVQVRVNGGAWVKARGLWLWNASCTLVPGINTIEACILDISAKYWMPVGVTVIVQPSVNTILGTPSSIGGLCKSLALKGTLACVGEGTRLLLLDAANPQSIRELGVMEMEEPILGLAVDGDLLYAAAGNAGMVVVDISNPAQPRRRGGYRGSKLAQAVALYNGLVCATFSGGRTAVLDMANPDRPRLCGEFASGWNLAISGSRVFTMAGGHTIEALDLSDPARPAVLGAYVGSISYYLACTGSMVLAYTGDGVTFYDFTNPAAPVLKNTLNFTEKVSAVQVEGNRMHVLLGNNSLRVYDISDTVNPKLLGTYLVGETGYALTLEGSLDYVATKRGLRILKTTETTDPLLVKSVTSYACQKIRVSGTWAVAQEGTRNLRLYDITNPKSPMVRGSVYTITGFEITDYAVQGGLVCVAISGGVSRSNLGVLALSSAGLSAVGSLDLANESSPSQIKIVGTRAYAVNSSSFQVIDLSNPALPKVSGSYAPLQTNHPNRLHLTVVGTTVFLGYEASLYGKLESVSVENPSNITMLKQLDASFAPVDLATIGSCAYVAYNTNYSNTQISPYDLTQITNPTVLAGLNHIDSPTGMHAANGRLYVTGGTGNINILTPSGRGELTLERTVTQSGTLNAEANGSVLLAACGAVGFKIFDLSYQHPTYLLGSYETIGPVAAVTAAGNIAWTTGNGWLNAVDMSDPDHLVWRSSLYIAALGDKPRLAGNRLYIPTGISGSYANASGITVVGIDNPAQPAVLGFLRTAYIPQDVTVEGKIAYVSEMNTHLEFFDMTDLAMPTLLGKIDVGESAGDSYSARYIEKIGPMLAVAVDWEGLSFVDVTDPAKPVKRMIFNSTGIKNLKPRQGLDGHFPVTDLAFDGTRLVLPSRYLQAVVLDCLDPAHPVIMAQTVGRPLYATAAAAGSLVALAGGGSYGYGSKTDTIDLYSLMNGGSMNLAESKGVPYPIGGMQFSGERLYLAGGDMGLQTLRLNLVRTAVKNWKHYE